MSCGSWSCCTNSDYLHRLLTADDSARSQHVMKRVLTILKVPCASRYSRDDDAAGVLELAHVWNPAAALNRCSFANSSSWSCHKRAAALRSTQRVRRSERELEKRYARRRCGTGSRLFWAGAIRDSERSRRCDAAADGVADMQHALVRSTARTRLAEFCERLVDLDEGLQEWRYRHVKMVERTIGTCRAREDLPGRSICAPRWARPVFPDLWAICTEF